MRIGQGIDVHAFSDDTARPLILCGVIVEGAPGLDGHSDADVATHSLIDAILGASGLGDLGRHFSSDDERFAGAASLDLLEVALAKAATAGFALGSADLTIVAQTPRLGHLTEEMATVLTGRCGAPVSVKATTTDHLGALGRAEGIGSLCVALLEER